MVEKEHRVKSVIKAPKDFKVYQEVVGDPEKKVLLDQQVPLVLVGHQDHQVDYLQVHWEIPSHIHNRPKRDRYMATNTVTITDITRVGKNLRKVEHQSYPKTSMYLHMLMNLN